MRKVIESVLSPPACPPSMYDDQLQTVLRPRLRHKRTQNASTNHTTNGQAHNSVTMSQISLGLEHTVSVQTARWHEIRAETGRKESTGLVEANRVKLVTQQDRSIEMTALVKTTRIRGADAVHNARSMKIKAKLLSIHPLPTRGLSGNWHQPMKIRGIT